jgi:hypothetical protein
VSPSQHDHELALKLIIQAANEPQDQERRTDAAPEYQSQDQRRQEEPEHLALVSCCAHKLPVAPPDFKKST